ncbi:PfkB family carbohydrate kinase [Nocardiopsis chromatogenes]|uniref:PfkB family carbohydrate kinase n=1 Tax=Nocardiopsis chromatogenes TaxID=280239 RepID=UPI0003711E52|nr:PfkB family carbohydrate kinase [Nocardiopsis chromatogenes]
MIIVCGEALVDLIPGDSPADWRALPGGGAANAAIALNRLGARAPLLCRLSRDHFGRMLRAHLEENGVDLRWAVDAPEQTTLAFVAFDDSGSAEYTFYAAGTADWQWSPVELPSQTAGACVHVGTLATVLEPGASVLRSWLRARRGQTVVSYDVNVRAVACPDMDAYRENARGWCDVAHVLKASADDLALLFPGRDPVEAAQALVEEHGLRLALVTLGGEGAVAVLPGREPLRAAAPPVDVVDTVGAGDAFIGAYLAELERRGFLEGPAALEEMGPDAASEALVFAANAAALACTRAGSSPPGRAEVEAALGKAVS